MFRVVTKMISSKDVAMLCGDVWTNMNSLSSFHFYIEFLLLTRHLDMAMNATSSVCKRNQFGRTVSQCSTEPPHLPYIHMQSGDRQNCDAWIYPVASFMRHVTKAFHRMVGPVQESSRSVSKTSIFYLYFIILRRLRSRSVSVVPALHCGTSFLFQKMNNASLVRVEPEHRWDDGYGYRVIFFGPFA